MVTGLAAGLVSLLVLAMLFQQLRISTLRSARLELLQQAELQAALRAECAHVVQLERKVQLLEAAIEDEALQLTGRHL